jgi:hypothetical protein
MAFFCGFVCKPLLPRNLRLLKFFTGSDSKWQTGLVILPARIMKIGQLNLKRDRVGKDAILEPRPSGRLTTPKTLMAL